MPEQKTIEDVKKFVKAINVGACMLRDRGIEEDNLFKIAYNQGGADVTRDILSFIDNKLAEGGFEEEQSDDGNNMYG